MEENKIDFNNCFEETIGKITEMEKWIEELKKFKCPHCKKEISEEIFKIKNQKEVF